MAKEFKGKYKRKIIAYMQETWSARRCPVCQGANWQLAEPVALITVESVGEADALFFEAIPVICLECGNSILVSLDVVAGLMEDA